MSKVQKQRPVSQVGEPHFGEMPDGSRRRPRPGVSPSRADTGQRASPAASDAHWPALDTVPRPMDGFARPAAVVVRSHVEKRRNPRRQWPAWTWGISGFVLGMVFWHLIGFWEFVGTVLLSPSPRERAPTAERQATPDGRGTAPAPVRAVGPVRATRPMAGSPGSTAAAPAVGAASWEASTQAETAPGNGDTLAATAAKPQ